MRLERGVEEPDTDKTLVRIVGQKQPRVMCLSVGSHLETFEF